MSYKRAIYLLHVTIPILIAVISIFIFSDLASKPEYTGGVIASIDESKEDALKLAASSTAVSVAITALPGDIATPVATNLADLSKGFMIVLCALYLEKFLLSVIGVVVFNWLIPIACGVYIVGFLTKNRAMGRLSRKLACFALILFLVVPVGAGISNLIRERYGDTIEQTIKSAEDSASLIEESVEDGNTGEDAGNGLGKILKNLQQAGDKIARGTSQFMKYLEKLVNRFIEVIAIMIVTSCVIPVLVVLGFVWLSRLIFSTGFGKEEKIEK